MSNIMPGLNKMLPNHHLSPVIVCVLESDVRAYWKGYLKLSLVSCPIALSPATSTTQRVSFRQINVKSGNRLRQQLVDDVSREPVEFEDRGKGYEIGKNEYVHVTDAELEEIELESNHTIEIDRFVPAAQIDKRFYDSAFYISPNDAPGIEAFAVIRDAMRDKGMVALGRVVMNKRERVIALEPHGKGMLGTTLYYPNEVRNADDHFEEIPEVKVPPEMLKLAEHILDTKAGDFDPDEFKDRYEDALVELIRKKQAQVPARQDGGKAAAPRNVINLMDALKQSIAAAEKKPKAAAVSRAKSAKKRA